MIITRKHAPLVAVALSAVVLLAGCTTSGGESPTTSAPSDTAPSPIPTEYQPQSGPGQTDPPASSEDAYVAADRTVKDFVAVQYEIQADVGANPDRIDPFATGSALAKVKSVATQLQEKKGTVTGAPTWTSDASTTTFGELTPAGGSTIANGIVYLKGCFDASKQTATNADGSPAQVADQRITATQFNVRYIPAEKSWKVDDAHNISGEPGAPQC
ncbi:hypothetical protein [Clavibacter nebraskensis]|uniref:hypothetical protein n=1 Tax=Clavibacter nebraskensis TaxID=31963 RepID=UPI003F4BEB63